MIEQFVDEQGQNLNRFLLTPVDSQENTYDLTRMAIITQQGTPISADVMNNIVDELNGMVDKIYPVGSVYTSVNNVNPSSLFGGTWVSFASGRTLIGVDTAQTEFNTVQKTGGEKTHTLTTTEIPSHTHMMIGTRSIPEDSSGPFKTPWSDGNPINLRSTGSTGGGQAHNNLPPYITVYFWLRTA